MKEYKQKNAYKIVVEKRPDEDFTRYIPMRAPISLLCEDDKRSPVRKSSLWKVVNAGEMFGKDYVKSKECAEQAIDFMEKLLKEQSGFYIVEEYDYTPKQ
jgi:hypothetical protein